MSKLSFSKFHGAGNDFILIDDRALQFNPNLVSHLCHRKFGIGADGVILLQNDLAADFRMRIYNADGTEAEMCGNGLRCFMKFLLDLGFPKQTYQIAAGKRIAKCFFLDDRIATHLGPVEDVKKLQIERNIVYSLNTGVPHAVVFSEERLEDLGPFLQNHPAFSPGKTNVSVAEVQDGSIFARVFERGVGETLSCGTAAAALGFIGSKFFQMLTPVHIRMPGGEFLVSFDDDGIILIGDAFHVFSGNYV